MEVALNFIKQHEGLRLKSYLDTAGIWTIGYGTRFYPNGTAVKKGETITLQQAEEYLANDVEWRKSQLIGSVKPQLSDKRWTAIISISYNIGIGGVKGSTFLRLINKDQNDPAIRGAIYMWNKITDPVTKKKVVDPGLVNRRKDEADLYFS